MASGAESLSTKTRRQREGAGEEREREGDFWLCRAFPLRSGTRLPYGTCGNLCVHQRGGRWDEALPGAMVASVVRAHQHAPGSRMPWAVPQSALSCPKCLWGLC